MRPVDEVDAMGWVLRYEDDGMTIEEIALEAGRSSHTIRRWLVRLGYTPRRAGQREGVGHLNDTAYREPRDQHWLRPTARIVRPSVQRQYR